MSQEKAAADTAADQSTPPGNDQPRNDQPDGGADATGSADQLSNPASSEQDSTGQDAAQAAADVSADAEPEDELTKLQQKLEQEAIRATESRDLMLRTRAEMENLRKRQARELENAHKYALDKIAGELLPVRDSLEMGISAASADDADLGKILEGSELTLKMLTGALEKFNIVEVDPVGEKFDPALHQAMSMQEGTDKPANTVLIVIQKGYTLNERLLRPAMVIIAK